MTSSSVSRAGELRNSKLGIATVYQIRFDTSPPIIISKPTMSSTNLEGKVALVTGATGGIGYATCIALAKQGCNVAVHYNSAQDTARALVREVESLGVKANLFQADMSDYEAVRRLHAEVESGMGNPEILYNNAGLTLGKSGIKSISEISIEDFEKTWRANCGSAFLLTQLCLPAMEKAQWGRVIFCSSVAGFTGGVVGPHYASSKSALHGLIHWLSMHYCAKGITVNGVAPALIEGTKMLPGGSEELKSKIPMGRLGRVEEVAETVLWFVRCGYVTNKVVGVDGGMFVQ